MNKIRNSVLSLVDRFDLIAPPVDPEFIAEQIGKSDNLQVRYVTLDEEHSSKIHGWYDFTESEIAVNVEDTIEEKLYTIAHELGHYLLHKEYSQGALYVPRMVAEQSSWEEQEADEFAVRLLLPEKIFVDYSEIFDDDHLRKYFIVTQSTIEAARQLY